LALSLLIAQQKTATAAALWNIKELVAVSPAGHRSFALFVLTET
jgi:hypothetical protein